MPFLWRRTCGAALLFGLWTPIAQGATIYVDDDTCPGVGDGSVGTPYCSIQDGIDAATSGLDQVEVAPGSYNEIIDLSGKKIAVYSSGGAAVTTIDATGVPDPGDGLPVVRCDSGEPSSTVIQGFTLTGGTGDTSGFGTPVGGGMYINAATPTARECVFLANGADAGSGMFINAASPAVIDCAFLGNTAITSGGMYNRNSSPTVTNCVFSGNAATNDAGGMFNTDNSAPTLTNCTFSGNTAVNDGGGMTNISSSSPTMTNCIFWGNSDAGGMDESAQIHTASGTPVVNYSDVQGGWTGAGGTGNLNADPLFGDADGADNTVGTADDNLRLLCTSPCIDAGDNAAVSAATDLDGNTRIVNTTVDMGAYEYQNSLTAVENVTQSLFYCSIQAAIDAAVNGDEIEVAPGTYNEIIDFSGKAITVRSTGGAGVTTIDATGVADPGDGLPVVRCDSGETSTTVLDGFTITGGIGDSVFLAGSPTAGGGMFINGTSPTVTDCVFTANVTTSGGKGGGMYSSGGSPTVTDCTFDGNEAAAGGGMSNEAGSNATVTGCVFDGNVSNGLGGGIHNHDSDPTVTNCTFIDNTSTANGGGMFNDNSDPVVTDCAFIGNASPLGGGMLGLNVSDPTITNCTFSGNSATVSAGGGISVGDGSPVIVNCTFSGNSAISTGGGIRTDGVNPTITNCTFSGNSSGNQGGGMYVGSGGNPTATNCIFWGNSDAGGMNESAQIHVASGTPVVNYSDVQGGWTGAGGTGNLNADPLFVDADGADNVVGTADDDLHVQAGSPCIDAGDNARVTTSTELDGNARIVNCVVDMGAYENQTASGTLVENVTQSTFYASLQAAIDAASPNDVIEASPCVYNEIIDFHGKAVTLRSTDPTNPAVVAATIIDATAVADPGTGKPVVRCDSGEGLDTVLDGFTITGGTGDTSHLLGGAPGGGGMMNFSTSPTVMNCVFVGNTAQTGGGIYNINSSSTVTHCAFIGNTASNNGGGMLNSNHTGEVTNSTFSGNSAGNVGGGALNTGGGPTLTNCTFSENTSIGNGGGIANGSGAGTTVTNCIFWGNSDPGGMDESAQIHVFSGAPVVNYSDVQGGWTGAGGTGNLNVDPLFVDVDGADNTAGTADDDLRLQAGSPCIDAGDDAAVSESTDLDGNPRIVSCVVDMGAYEDQTLPGGIVPADRDCDGDVDGVDFAVFASCFNKAGNPPRTLGCDLDDAGALDFDDDVDVDGVDFASFASCFNKAGNPPRTLNCPQD